MQKKILLIIITVSVVFLHTSCNSSLTMKGETKDEMAMHIDSTINPGHDFFAFANNAWFKQHPIPATESIYGIFKVIQDSLDNTIRNICEQASTSQNAKGSAEQKIGDFFASGMDTNAINKAGLAALQRQLDTIAHINTLDDVWNVTAYLHTIGVSAMFSTYVGKDDKISSKHAVFFSQGGLGLPERDYYFENDDRTKKIREAYKVHIGKMAALCGKEKNTDNYVSDVFSIEEQLAKASRKLEDLRDPQKNYNKMDVATAQSLMPAAKLTSLLQQLHFVNVDTVIIGQPEFFTAFNTLYSKTSVQAWKNYLHWNLINTFAANLSSDFENQNFDFYEKTLSGKKAQKPRWKTMVNNTDGMLGELIGQVYVEKYLPKGTKEKLLEIGKKIMEVYAHRIQSLDWMSEPTKQKALYKLGKITMKFGYPDKWKDMSSVNITRDNYLQNVMAINIWAHLYNAAKYGKPVDRNEWAMQPQTYNAYYDPGNNEIVVPACNIMVPGYEGKMADDAILYSIIGGSTIGHEITHGFDDQGSQYDADGNLNDWWTADDKRKFKEKTLRIVNQFDAFTVLDSMHVNGDATQGENIADLGGIIMGYEAFKNTEQYKKGELIGGLTPDQRFFLGYAFAWMLMPRDEYLAKQIRVDVHSPAKFRVNGPLANMPEFHKAFNVTPGQAMFMPDSTRVQIW